MSEPTFKTPSWSSGAPPPPPMVAPPGPPPPPPAGPPALPIPPLPEPLEGRLYLGGYDGYLGRPGQGVNDDLYARALILNQGQTTVVLVALDLVGITNAHIARIRRAASTRLRIPEDRVLVAWTPTP